MRENRRRGIVLGDSATFSSCPCADCVPATDQQLPQTIPLTGILTNLPKHPYSGQDFLVATDVAGLVN
ncbi:hypothetical protein DV515_00005384 [Chloebia gouldiae]|uniref:Uncharacterized protein n=1 Tax=Chloebia gouldiae TaxID=44316 RepID=A0A3L8SP62_CHLGU|nr:hypothetical protein DV515_00005384 [Chloebia gouldiae]